MMMMMSKKELRSLHHVLLLELQHYHDTVTVVAGFLLHLLSLLRYQSGTWGNKKSGNESFFPLGLLLLLLLLSLLHRKQKQQTIPDSFEKISDFKRGFQNLKNYFEKISSGQATTMVKLQKVLKTQHTRRKLRAARSSLLLRLKQQQQQQHLHLCNNLAVVCFCQGLRDLTRKVVVDNFSKGMNLTVTEL
jgi:hypothetical protein